MHLRFLAAAGDEAALDRTSLAVDARQPNDGRLIRRDGPGLRIWTDAQTPLLASTDATAFLVGQLFQRGSGRSVEQLDRRWSEDKVLQEFWGNYALFTCQGRNQHRVLRDPSGAVPVYHYARNDLNLYASDADMLRAAITSELRPDPDFVRHWLSFSGLRTARAGLVGVRELLPGEARTVSRDGAETRLAWNPWRFAAPREPFSSFEEAATRLRKEILSTVPIHVPDGDDPVLQLSGGLDSSIVASALAHAARPFRAVTFATRSADGDERAFARIVASSSSAPLAELTEGRRTTQLELSGPPSFRPPPNAVLQPMKQDLADHLAASGATLVLGGAGGDNVFCLLSSASPALDALRQAGVRQAVATLRDVAEQANCTVWTAALAALRKARRAPTRRYWRRDLSFLAPAAAPGEPERHPWLDAPKGALPGKKEHVEAIVSIHHFLDGLSSATGAAYLHPLLSQPVMELCLGIPSWQWIRGGRDRAVARQAFTGLVPDEILRRRNKGRLESMYVQAYMAARRQLEDHLLHGELHRLRIIDRESVRTYLRVTAEPRDTGYIRLFELAAMESWLRSWRR